MNTIYGCPKCYNMFDHPGNRPDGCSACGYEDVITFQEALEMIASYEDFRRDLIFDEEEQEYLEKSIEEAYEQTDIFELLEGLEDE